MGCGAGARKYAASVPPEPVRVRVEPPAHSYLSGTPCSSPPALSPEGRVYVHGSEPPSLGPRAIPPGCPPLKEEHPRHHHPRSLQTQCATTRPRRNSRTATQQLALDGDLPGDDWGEVARGATTHAFKRRCEFSSSLAEGISPGNVPTSVVGIDLGTVYSCVAVYNEGSGHVEVVTNEQGNRTTPSCVAFTDSERLIGERAVNQAARNPKNTVFDAKRLLGRDFSDPLLQSDIKSLPFKFTEGHHHKLAIEVNYKGARKRYHLEEISSMVVGKLKRLAESFLGREVVGAVITVPACFNYCQRQATIDAACTTGLECLQLLSEPTAAALAYMYDGRAEHRLPKNILVFNMGGGYFDVSLMTITDKVCDVKAMAGGTRLGGVDFDTRIVAYCVQVFKDQNGGRDPSGNQRALRRLRSHCERTKRILSSSKYATIEVDDLVGHVDFQCELSRSMFEELNADHFRKLIDPIETVLRESGTSKKAVHDIVLVGDFTRTPKVQAVVQEFFDGKEPCKTINPSEAMARGAAVHAACLARRDGMPGCKGFDDTFSLVNVTPASLGVETSDGVMMQMVHRNTSLPAVCEHIFTTQRDGQPSVVIRVFEGEHFTARQNSHLGNLRLELVPPVAKGVAQIVVAFRVDTDGVLSVKAEDLLTGKVAATTFQKGSLSSAEAERRFQELEMLAHQDAENTMRIKARHTLENTCYKVRTALLEYCKQNTTSSEVELFERKLDNILDWLEFGDPLPLVAAELKRRFPAYNFGFDQVRQELPGDAPLRRLEMPLKESNKGYRVALDSIAERDTLQALSEMDCERACKRLLLTDATIADFNQLAECRNAGAKSNMENLRDVFGERFAEFSKLPRIDPDPLEQPQHTVADLMRVAAAAQDELRLKFAPSSEWVAVPGKSGQHECTTSAYADLIRDPGIKTEERVRQKANVKYRQLLDRRFMRVRDISRMAFTHNTLESLLLSLDRIRKEFKVVEIENRFAKPTAMGWRDVVVLIEMPVQKFVTLHIVEIQMSHRALVDARQSLHKHWRVVRELLPGTCMVTAGDMDEVQDIILCELESSGLGTWNCTADEFRRRLDELRDAAALCGVSEFQHALAT